MERWDGEQKEAIERADVHIIIADLHCCLGFPDGSDSKETAYNAGDPSSIPGLGRPPGEGNGNPLCILAWIIPWTEEPGMLQSMGLQRVRHN